MERHFKLHIVEAFAMLLLIGIYSLLFIPLVYYTDLITITHVAIITGIFVFINFFYGTIRTWWKHRGHYMPRENAPHIYEYLDELADEFGTRKPRLVVFDSDVPNAYATDTLPTRPIVAITSGLMNQLEAEEIRAVIAHEMSHIRSYDVFFMLFLSSFVNVIEKAHGFTTNFVYNGDDAFERLIFVVPFIITWINLQIVYMILFFVSRVREFVADKDAAIATEPESMWNALDGITSTMDEIPEGQQKQFHGESALTIIPLQKFKTKLFSTHPPTKKRLKKLEEIQQETEQEDKEMETDDTTSDKTDEEHTEPPEENVTDEDDPSEEDVEYPTDLSLRGNKE